MHWSEYLEWGSGTRPRDKPKGEHEGGAGGAPPPQDSRPTHIGDIGLGLGYLGYGFGIGLFGIQVWDWVIWDLGYLGYGFWDLG